MFVQSIPLQNHQTKSLRFVRSGAATMNETTVKQLEDLLKVPVVDSYGMTETGGGVFSTLPGFVGPANAVGVPISPGLEVKV